MRSKLGSKDNRRGIRVTVRGRNKVSTDKANETENPKQKRFMITHRKHKMEHYNTWIKEREARDRPMDKIAVSYVLYIGKCQAFKQAIVE